MHDAVHEAGHAVAAIALGRGAAISRLVAGTRKGRGFCAIREDAWDLNRSSDRLDVVTFAMAGMEAERRRWRKPIREYWWLSGWEDGRRAIFVATLDIDFRCDDGVAVDDPATRDAAVEEVVEAGRVRAREIVKGHWAAVAAVAIALITKPSHELSGADVRKIARDADPMLSSMGRAARRRCRLVG